MIDDFRPDGDAPRYFGVYPAIVTDIVDPDSLGRIEVKFPWLGGDGADARAWATLLTPYADDDQGFEVLPEVDTQVVVAFEAGDVRRPYIVGSAWNGRESLPESPAAANNKRLIKTRAGSLLEFDDTDGAAKVTLSMKSGHKLVMSDSSQDVKLTHSNGCIITFSASGQIQIQANSTVEVTASAVNVHAAMAKFDGVVKCTTLIANAVVSSSYTPGSGQRMVNGHPWLLVGPWYRWEQAGLPSSGRASAPALQKFASDDFVNEFIKQPQHSLKFDPDVDQVYAVHYESAQLSAGPLLGKFATLYPLDADGKANPTRTKLVPTQVRKLFLATHSRHYVVTCELHCDLAGFPCPSRDEACQIGFVVRRQYLSYPESAKPFATKLLKEIVAVQSKLAELDETAPLRPRATQRRAQKMQAMKVNGTFLPARQALVDQLTQLRTDLDKWKTTNGVSTIRQGWVPSEHERVGEWQLVEDEPQELTEAWFPLYPVFADPAVPDHDAAGRTMYFGVVPTTSFDTDSNGKARFDERSIYEIRCFVRRHDPHCPRKQEAPDCHGPLTWSCRTERYQLAAQFDLDGTSNRPITIQMPNLAELAAQAVKRPFGKYSPVKFIQPQSLQPKTDGMALAGKEMGGFQICFFSIPLITIIALFVLNIFLPIVVFLFGLWFLLAFKFCIPPSLSLDVKLQAELDAVPPQVDADFSVQVDLDFDGIKEATKTTLDINTDLKIAVEGDIAKSTLLDAGKVSGVLGTYANSPMIDLNSNNVEVAKMPKNVKDDPPVGVDYTASLEYEERRSPVSV